MQPWARPFLHRLMALGTDGLAMAPLKTCARDQFIARHIIWVKISPDAPTMAPTATSNGSDMVKPTIVLQALKKS